MTIAMILTVDEAKDRLSKGLVVYAIATVFEGLSDRTKQVSHKVSSINNNAIFKTDKYRSVSPFKVNNVTFSTVAKLKQ